MLAAASPQGVARKRHEVDLAADLHGPVDRCRLLGGYGWGTGDLVVIGANSVSLCLIVTVLIAKLRYG